MLWVTVMVALASINNSAPLADNAVEGISDVGEKWQDDLDDYSKDYDDLFLQIDGSPEAEPIKDVVVPVQPGMAKAPDPTIETLTPKHEKKKAEEFKTANNGREPDKIEKMELKRMAVQSAADEINTAQQNKDGLEIAKNKEKRLIRKIKRDKQDIDKVSKNEEYAARKAYETADRKVKYLESKSNRRTYEAEDELHKLNKEKEDTKRAYTKRMKAKKDILEAKERHVEEQRKVDHAQNSVMKAKTILAKAKSTIEESKDEVIKKTDFLNNIEAHEADARLEYRQAKIAKEFEEDDARKVGLLLKRLTAKKRAIFKFTKSLDQKAQRDFRAAEAGIEKAKSDYEEAKSQFDHFTKMAGKFEKKLIDTQKNVELAKKGVVMGVNAGRDSMAIKSAENYSSLKKKERKDQTKVDSEDIKAKGQNKMMGAAMAELAKSEALETVARKQKDTVKQHRITMRMQVEKIDFLKNEVRKHKEKAEEADKKAKAAMHKIKNMRKDAIRARDEAKARARYAKHIDVPMASRAAKKATQIYDRDKYTEKAEDDNIMTLHREARQYYLQARKLKKQRENTEEKVKKAVDRASFAKKKMQKAESKRDKTLAHNKSKMAAINERLNKAEVHFNRAKKKVEEAPPAPTPAPIERDSQEREEAELGDARGHPDLHRGESERRPRYDRRGDRGYRARRYGGYARRGGYREHRWRRGEYRRERRERRYPRRGRLMRGGPRFHKSLGESQDTHSLAADDAPHYSAESMLRKHPLELP